MTPYEASQNLETIRLLMERTGRYSNLSGISCITAGALSIGGSAVCRWQRVGFEDLEPSGVLIAVWAVVLATAFIQNVVWTVINARRRQEPAWSHLAQTVAGATLPAFFTGAVITGYALSQNAFGILPGIWMLTYGTGVLGASLFAGSNLKVFGTLFLLAGAFSLHWRQHGVEMMAASFGLFHIGVGIAIAWKYRV